MEKKSLIIMGGTLIGILVILLVVVWAITNLKPVKYTFEELETKIHEATVEYYHENPSALPLNDGTYNLDYSVLESNGYMKPLNEITESSQSCSAHVIILKEGTEYTYIPYLNCGTEYTTKELYKQVLYNNPVVTSGSGLYQTPQGEYYFRGKVDNNYVVFGSEKKGNETTDIMWRIMSINNNTIKLRAVDSVKSTKWDNRFNSTENSYDGYNDFDLSLFSDYLKDLKENKVILSESENAKLVSQQLCINTRTLQDTTKDGSTECAKLSIDYYYYSSILPYEFIRASLDPECTTMGNRSCSNYNYLAKLNQADEWVITASPTANNLAYVFGGNLFKEEKTNNSNSLYPVIVLNRFAFFKSGNGTEEDPYRIK